MRRFSWVLRLGVLFLFATGIAGQAGGCDGGGSKRASQYSSLVGTWRIERVDLGGAELALQDTVQLEFLAGEGRHYRLKRPSQEQPVTAEGAVNIPDANVLSMTEGFSRPLLWTFDFGQPNDLTVSVRFSLRSTWEGSSQAFLSAIGQSGSARTIEVDLMRVRD